MTPRQSIVSLFVTAALSLPCVVFAADYTTRAPSSTDEARAMAAQAEQAELAKPSTCAQPVATRQPTTTDEARADVSQRLAFESCEQAQVAKASGCPTPVATSRPTMTDEWRADVSQRLALAREGCEPTHG